MTDGISDPNIIHSSAREDPKTRKDRLISDGEKLFESKGYLEERELRELILELISIYDNPFNAYGQRERAASVVSSLAGRYDLILDLVIENAQAYAETLHIDDASPYSQNSFDVLARSGSGNTKVVSFLQHTIKTDWGIPRWEATKALCELDDPQADRIIIDIIQGKYPPKFLDLKRDLAKIQEVKGESFVERHQL